MRYLIRYNGPCENEVVAVCDTLEMGRLLIESADHPKMWEIVEVPENAFFVDGVSRGNPYRQKIVN